MEKVFVFEEGQMEGFSGFPGASADPHDLWYFMTKVMPSGDFMDRDKAEVDPKYKQVIPYVVVTKGDNVLVYKRTKKGGEGRLHDKRSVGIGGHMNPIDTCISSCITRELEEEFDFSDIDYEKADIFQVGLIYDPSNEVGQVHFGVVYLFALNENDPSDGPTPREDSVTEATWVNIDNALKIEELENWSKLALGLI